MIRCWAVGKGSPKFCFLFLPRKDWQLYWCCRGKTHVVEVKIISSITFPGKLYHKIVGDKTVWDIGNGIQHPLGFVTWNRIKGREVNGAVIIELAASVLRNAQLAPQSLLTYTRNLSFTNAESFCVNANMNEIWIEGKPEIFRGDKINSSTYPSFNV